MKRRLTLLGIALLTASIALTGCGPKRYKDTYAQRGDLIVPEVYLANDNSYFNLYYIIDPATNVVYYFAYTMRGISITPMLNSDGSLVTKDKLLTYE